MFSPSKPSDFVSREKYWMNQWEKTLIFSKSVVGDKTFVFYDGPPFATGLPHYGHLLASVVKDVVPRYKAMNGFKVERKFGWDCHGVPVENEVQKKLNLHSRDEVLTFGVHNFNEECRSIVLKYTSEWKQTVKRVGRWVDMDNPYHTMDLSFMNSVWWVWKQLWNKGLVYQSYKVVPFSTGLNSVLSNFEASQNYQEVKDLSLTVEFEAENGLTFLVWTTTPWTLPMNVGLAVNSNLNYCVVEHNNKNYVVEQNKVKELFGDNAVVTKTFLGSELSDLKYKPLFDFFKDEKAFKVVMADFVKSNSGTGVVHLSPCYGEEDFYCAKANNLPLFSGVDDKGCYFDFMGETLSLKNVFECNEKVKDLLENKVFKAELYSHSYPFCYRTNKRLMYKAVTSWYVNVESFKDNLLKNNKTTNWNPSHLRDGRFGNWLENARDWCVSRNRFWGTPLPVWQNTEGEMVSFASSKELEEATGQVVKDLHPHYIQHLKVKSPTGGSDLEWVGLVFDCWFESGSMPYASHSTFPADFIAEGLDQTRGWFYTLMVLGTALYDQAPFKNVNVNGLVLAEDGKKMAKSLKNYPDPNNVLEECGADALRLYFLDKPVVVGEELKFSLSEVKEQAAKNVLRTYNVNFFFSTYANLFDFKPENDYEPKEFLNKWLYELTNSLTKNLVETMDKYQLNNVTNYVTNYVEELTNTYLKFAKPYFKKGEKDYLNSLYWSLLKLSKLLAPFTPFMAEELYKSLHGQLESVHLETYPKYNESYEFKLTPYVNSLKNLLELGRNYRLTKNLGMKLPLKSLTLVDYQERLTEFKSFENLLKNELNVRAVFYTQNVNKYLTFTLKPNYAKLGKMLGSKMKTFATELKKANVSDVINSQYFLYENQKYVLNDDLELLKQVKNEEVCFDGNLTLFFDLTVDTDQKQEEEARSLLRKVQELRKEKLLNPGQFVVLYLNEEKSQLYNLFKEKFSNEAYVKEVVYNKNYEVKLDKLVL